MPQDNYKSALQNRFGLSRPINANEQFRQVDKGFGQWKTFAPQGFYGLCEPLSQRHSFGILVRLADIRDLATKLALLDTKRVRDLTASLFQRLSFGILVGYIEIPKLTTKSFPLITKPLQVFNIIRLRRHEHAPPTQYRRYLCANPNQFGGGCRLTFLTAE